MNEEGKHKLRCQSHVSWGFFKRYNYKYHTEEKEEEEDCWDRRQKAN